MWGILPHIKQSCFKPFQGLFCISTSYRVTVASLPAKGFKPFQGLFCISTGSITVFTDLVLIVSNPSRGYSAFLPLTCSPTPIPSRFQTLPGVILHFYLTRLRKPSMTTISFKPFQGLFCISTMYSKWLSHKSLSVSNPSRGYSAFLRKCWNVIAGRQRVSNPSRGYSAFLPAAAIICWTSASEVSNPSRGYSAFLPRRSAS